jgi:sporulation protein YlmC with PRC-barrel domain
VAQAPGGDAPYVGGPTRLATGSLRVDVHAPQPTVATQFHEEDDMNHTNDAPTLYSLNDEPYDVKNRAEDIRKRTVVDRDGDEIGTVDDLLIDGHEYKVRFLQVKDGGFLGIGGRHFLVPVDAVTRVTEDTVSIDQSRAHVGDGPVYDPTVASDEEWRRGAFRDEGYYPGVYRHYGYAPFWGPGYVYPGYPFVV